MKFRKHLTQSQREQLYKERIRALEVLAADNRQQISDLKRLVREQRRRLQPAKVLERCDDCGLPTKYEMAARTVTLLTAQCATCGQARASNGDIVVGLTTDSHPPAGIGAASAMGII